MHSLTRKVTGGNGVCRQLVRVLQSKQSFGCSCLVLIRWEKLSLIGQIGDEP